MTFNQSGFETSRERDHNGDGWNQCFRKLTAHLASNAR